MKKYIIIQGCRNSGKDTIVNYINWLLNTNNIFHYYWIAKLFKFKPFFNRWHTTKYATPIKKILSIILNVPEEKFEDRSFKEYWYFSFKDFKLCHINELKSGQFLTDKDMSRKLKKDNLDFILEYYLSIRQILQVFGTEVMRKFFGDKLWINITLSKDEKNIIVADQRFEIENFVSSNIYHSNIIHINRPNNQVLEHRSEMEVAMLYEHKKYDYLIENDGTLKDLFYKCKNIIKQICG